MNKTDKIIAFVLVLCLVGWMWHSMTQEKARTAEAHAQVAVAHAQAAAAQAQAAAAQQDPIGTAAKQVARAVEQGIDQVAKSFKQGVKEFAAEVTKRADEKVVALENEQLRLDVSSWGAVIKSATFKKYAQRPGALNEQNPALKMNFGANPLMALGGVAGCGVEGDFVVVTNTANSVTLRNLLMTRRITLMENYRVEVEDEFIGPFANSNIANTMNIGAMAMGSSKNDILSIDSWVGAFDTGKVIHHSEEGELKGYLAGSAGGCSGKSDARGLPEVSTVKVSGAQRWIAVKNRFFVTALVKCSEENDGFAATVRRDTAQTSFALREIAAAAKFSKISPKRTTTLYIGPKMQSLLWDLNMRDVMEFGMWRWVAYPVVWLLNACHDFVPSYGLAIILLTFIVRIVFWPLTHKSTVSMRRMQELQPKLKEIQARCKGNQQKLQQETWTLYRENKVNPMSGCLPMLIQIPVFIALFTVLRSAVELRYAPFLWIADLSEPEGLFANVLPFGGLNILPILMAVTMGLQSWLTPSTGDKQQQRMMAIMMPVMMLFMFYSFPSALSLYWTLSQVISIVQMYYIRKRYTPAAAKEGVVIPEVVETRQQRRHQ